MTTTIDSAGRLVVPKAIREEAGLRPDMPLEIRCREGCVEIQPAARRVQRIKEGRVSVAVAVAPDEPLKNDTVRRFQGQPRGRHA
ncbi:MAG TPA: AbrB/MazE/SpoVT family DNA-binding domain-containing protein [Polyangia bacterium]|jgi:looped-hinge helix DNA binding domain, AbrB family|nr:AbrB/MazE/SpoVT family DNA-binding domain-containing protein [Polyangia bacterium]